MSVTITGLSFTTLDTTTKQPTAYPAQGSDEIYLLPSGAKFRVTPNNDFIAYPTVLQFINLFPKLIGVDIIWPWQKNLKTILNTWFNIGINNKNHPKIICSFRVDTLGDICAYYGCNLVDITLWKSDDIYYIEIIIPENQRDGDYYNIIRDAIGLT